MSAPGQYMPYQPAYPAPQRTNGMAIASLICSLAGLFCGFTAVLGVIFGFVARGQIRRSGGAEGGSGLALAGIVIGLVVCALIVVWILVLTVGGIAAHTTKTSLGMTGYWGTWA